jgi:hypothetical protein
MTEEVSSAPAIGINLTVAPSDGRSLILQTHVPQDVSPEAFDALVDKLYARAERLVNRAAAASLDIIMEKLTDEHNDQVEQYSEGVDTLVKLEARLEALSGDRLSAQDRMESKNVAAQVNALRDQIKTHMTNEKVFMRHMARLQLKQKKHVEKAK